MRPEQPVEITIERSEGKVAWNRRQVASVLRHRTERGDVASRHIGPRPRQEDLLDLRLRTGDQIAVGDQIVDRVVSFVEIGRIDVADEIATGLRHRRAV